MPKVIILTGSVRPNSAGRKVLPILEEAIRRDGRLKVDVVEVGNLNLPWFDAPVSPKMPGFTIEHTEVQTWSDIVSGADGVILLTPEYNAGLPGVQKNAIDWLGKEWTGKPIALVGYGFHFPSRSQEATKLAFAQVEGKVADPQAQLVFNQDIQMDGGVISQESIDQKLDATISALGDLIESVSK